MSCNHGIFLCTLLILAHASAGEYGDRIKNATETTINLEMQESRYHGYAVPHPHTELPVNFQAPYANARDYWTEAPRRTFYDYPQDSFIRPITEGINTFYSLMNTFFGTEETPRRKPSYQNYPTKAPYEFEQQYQQPYRQQYLPAPSQKPLRASIIKLEPQRVTPQYAPTTVKYYPQFVKILNDVLVENSYNNQLAALGLADESIIEKPEALYVQKFEPTTYKPKHKPFTQKTTPFPGSIQDKLPPVKTGQDTRIPYVSEQPLTSGTTGNIVFHETKQSVTPVDVEVDVRHALQSVAKLSTAPITFQSSTLHTPRSPALGSTTEGTTVIRTSTPFAFETTTQPQMPRRTPRPSAIRTSTPVLFESATAEIPRRTASTTFKPVVFESVTIKTVPITFETTTDGKEGEFILTTRQPTFAETTALTMGSLPESEQRIVANNSAVQPSEHRVVAYISEVQPPTTSNAVNEIIIEKDEEMSTTSENPSTTEESTVIGTTETWTQPPTLLIQPSEVRPIRTELIQNIEPIEQPRFSGPFPKKLNPDRPTTTMTTTDPTISTDYVTDLTIRGLSDERRKGSSVNIQSRRISNVFNMSTVVDFEIARVNGTAPPLNFETSDELSLDAKILKDTNWDGYQPPIPTTLISPLAADTQEIIDTPKTEPTPIITSVTTPTTEEAVPTTLETTFSTLGTTEMPATTLPSPIAVDNDTIIATRITKTISKSLRGRQPSERRGRVLKVRNDELNTETSSKAPERAKKYQRRVRVQTFTPYPSQLNLTESGETTLNLGKLTRPFQPRRSRPNATLAFGNREAIGKSEDMSGEREVVRRKSPRKELYSGRTYPSQLRRRPTDQVNR